MKSRLKRLCKFVNIVNDNGFTPLHLATVGGLSNQGRLEFSKSKISDICSQDKHVIALIRAVRHSVVLLTIIIVAKRIRRH